MIFLWFILSLGGLLWSHSLACVYSLFLTYIVKWYTERDTLIYTKMSFHYAFLGIIDNLASHISRNKGDSDLDVFSEGLVMPEGWSHFFVLCERYLILNESPLPHRLVSVLV